MNFKTTEVEDSDIVIIKLPDKVKAEISDELKLHIRNLVKNGQYKFIMDLEDTSFMDSSGLGALVSKIAVTRSNNGDVRLANPHRYIANLLELTHLDQVIKSYSSVDDAVLSFKEGSNA